MSNEVRFIYLLRHFTAANSCIKLVSNSLLNTDKRRVLQVPQRCKKTNKTINVIAQSSGKIAQVKKLVGMVFTTLHGMQMRSCDEISVRLSVCQTRAL